MSEQFIEIVKGNKFTAYSISGFDGVNYTVSVSPRTLYNGDFLSFLVDGQAIMNGSGKPISGRVASLM